MSRFKLRHDALAAFAPCDGGMAVAVVARAGKGKPSLESLRFLAGGSEAVEHELAAVVDELGAARTRCSTVLPREDYRLLQVDAPDVPPAELRAAVRWRIKELLDFHVDDAVLDVFEIPAQRRAGAHMMFAVAARASRVRGRIELLEAAGARLEVIDIEELALRNLTAVLPEDERGVVLLRLHREHGIINVTRRGNLYLSRRFDTGAGELEAAARLQGNADTGSHPELSAASQQIALEIQRSIDYYDSHFSQPSLAAVVVAPSFPALGFLPDVLAEHLACPVRRLELGEIVDGALPADARIEASCINAVGAALRLESLVL